MSETRVVLYTAPRTVEQQRHERYNSHNFGDLGCVRQNFDNFKSKFEGRTGGIFELPYEVDTFTHLIESFGPENISVINAGSVADKVTTDVYVAFIKAMEDFLSQFSFIQPQNGTTGVWYNVNHL